MGTDGATIVIATRGSALALAQADLVLAQCRAAFPKLAFERKVIKTAGDKLQTPSLARQGKGLPKGLFTKELEVALLQHWADLAVHSLKDLDATVLALAGLTRLNLQITPQGRLQGEGVPNGLLATILETDVMLPCAGQGAIGIEVRNGDERMATICGRLNHFHTQQCVTAERAFLAAMGGGCQSPLAAYAEIVGEQLRMRVLSFADGQVRRAEAKRAILEPAALGSQRAAELSG